jgi:hypothetical protein
MHLSKVQGKREHKDTQPKEKQKQAINKNKVKTYANRTYGYKMTININKEDLR